MFTTLQYRILKRISPGSPNRCTGSAYEGKSKLAILLGEEFLSKIPGKASSATRGRGANQLRANLVSPLGWASIFYFPVGTPDIQRESFYPLEIHL